MADKEYKTRQEKKNKGKYSTNGKEIYNSKHIRSYERNIERNKKSHIITLL
jgi:hypothetical protein